MMHGQKNIKKHTQNM